MTDVIRVLTVLVALTLLAAGCDENQEDDAVPVPGGTVGEGGTGGEGGFGGEPPDDTMGQGGAGATEGQGGSPRHPDWGSEDGSFVIDLQPADAGADASCGADAAGDADCPDAEAM